MITLALGLLLLVLAIGGRRGLAGLWSRLGSGLAGPARVWRPTAGLGALVLLVIALVLAVREDWLPALVLAAVGAGLAVSARLRARSAARPAEDRGGGMGLAEARAILGVGPEATAAEIQSAYRRLMRSVHPDRGGTRGLAAQLNAARDRLLKTRGRPATG